MNQQEPQTVPVRVYESNDRYMIASPLPGLEPQDIMVKIERNRVTLQGALRGPRQDETSLLAAEWTVGPYYRELSLPLPVNGELTNATYGNGVVVLVLPKLQPGQQAGPVAFHLEPARAPRGGRVGHTGQDIQPTTTAEQRQKSGWSAESGRGQ